MFMNILVANDDGINSEGIRQLVEELAKIADVYVVAPDSQKSSTSHHLTISGRIRYEKRSFPYAKKAYALWATPADCVHMGLAVLVDKKIDLVVSGINQGRNVSTDIIYSGTIAAAREAYIAGIPSMAVSLDSFTSSEFKAAAEYAREIALDFMKMKNNRDFFISVNVPAISKDAIKGIRICDDDISLIYDDVYTLSKDGDKDYIVIENGGVSIEEDEEKLNVDYNALKCGYVTISALHNEHISLKYNKVLKEYYKG